MSSAAIPHPSRLFRDPASVLDATLRDAGYLNDWAFSGDQISAVVTAVAAAGVEAVEVGYLADHSGLPPAARCDAPLLAELRAQVGPEMLLAAMVGPATPRPETLFASRRQLLDLVRVPCTYEQLGAALTVAEAAREQGIAASVNLVNISTLLPEQLIQVSRQVAAAGVADILYLADSRGACRPEEVSDICAIVREHWPGLLGFHAHDNTGFATVNPRMALAAGCQLVDGSVNGLGLGSGNTRIAHAMALVQQQVPDKPYDYGPIDTVEAGFWVSRDATKSYLYYLVGAKNFAQLWVEPLLERYGADTARRLEAIPRRPYTHIDQVIAEIET